MTSTVLKDGYSVRIILSMKTMILRSEKRLKSNRKLQKKNRLSVNSYSQVHLTK